jgi:hypothetical protein
MLATSLVDPAEVAILAHKAVLPEIAAQFLKQASNFAQKSRVYCEMGDWANAFRFAEAALDQDVVFQVLREAIVDPKSFPFLYNSSVCLYLGIRTPIVADEGRLTAVLHFCNGKVQDPHFRFGLPRAEPRQVLPSCLQLAQSAEFARFYREQTGDPQCERLPVNSMLCLFASRGQSGKSVKAFATRLEKTVGMNSIRSYVIRLKYYARTHKWAAFIKLGSKSKCSSLQGLCLELCNAFGSSREVDSYLAAANENRSRFQAKCEPVSFDALFGKHSCFSFFGSK